MGKKVKQDNTMLWVAGAVAIGWFLAPKGLKEQITGGVPGIGIDLSGLLGGGVGQAPLDFGGLIPEFQFPSWEFPPFPETPLLDYTGIIQDILDAGNTAAGVIGAAGAAAANAATGGAEKGSDDVAPTPPPAPQGTWEWLMEEFTGLHPVVKNVLAGTVGVGGVYGAVKWVQALAPGGRTVATEMGNVVARALRGKAPLVTGVTPTAAKPPKVKPRWVSPKLARQWQRFAGLPKGGTPFFAIGAIGDWFNRFLFTPEVTTEEMVTPGMLWTGSGRYEPPDITLPTSTVTRPERTYITEPVPMRAERPSPRPLTLTEKYGTPEVKPKKRLYQPPLEGVQW